jgi:Protein of unknown function (DUF2946)
MRPVTMMNNIVHPFLPTFARQSLKTTLSRWLLVLAVLWQALVIMMPVAQAKAAAGDGRWETICTMQGSSQVWMAGDDTDTDPQAKSGGHCPLCVMSQSGVAPPTVFDFKMHQAAGAEVGQLAFTAAYLTRAWSEPATGPPAQR